MLLSCHVRISRWIYTLGLNVKELLAGNRSDIWIVSDSLGIWTPHRLIRKRTLDHLAKLGKWLVGWVFVYKLSSCDLEPRYYHLKA